MSITSRTLNNLKPDAKPYFLRDKLLKGFGVKVNPSGTIKFIAEVRHDGRTSRKTLGDYGILNLNDARHKASDYILKVKSGQLKKEEPLDSLFRQYVSGGRLKQRTITDYQEAIHFYLQDWLNIPVGEITKEMVEKRFYKIRDKGINGGIPTLNRDA